ncbi:hypothetical protein BESB_080390 [Besnoitia besnoiti]|uniref:Uncharacterized protein n=1 Tax=Besnoitia besnoiti TaxID=94643 RepID=A0A2A9MDS4_BESBE|nr:hypothetical protein BESB_080390 [Besnoitia besnoiti]PFH33823.1 hypothetical protein BESB_080390 [Besnoitia besnoiti]
MEAAALSHPAPFSPYPSALENLYSLRDRAERINRCSPAPALPDPASEPPRPSDGLRTAPSVSPSCAFSREPRGGQPQDNRLSCERSPDGFWRFHPMFEYLHPDGHLVADAKDTEFRLDSGVSRASFERPQDGKGLDPSGDLEGQLLGHKPRSAVVQMLDHFQKLSDLHEVWDWEKLVDGVPTEPEGGRLKRLLYGETKVIDYRQMIPAFTDLHNELYAASLRNARILRQMRDNCLQDIRGKNATIAQAIERRYCEELEELLDSYEVSRRVTGPPARQCPLPARQCPPPAPAIQKCSKKLLPRHLEKPPMSRRLHCSASVGERKGN